MKTKNLDVEVDRLAALNYTVVLRNDEDGDVVAYIKELEGCVAHGEDAMDALAELESMKRLWIESCLTDGKPVPMPCEDEDDLPSGKWLQRVPRTLHRKLIEAAKQEDVSLNMFVTSCLSEAIGKRQAFYPAITVDLGASSEHPVGEKVIFDGMFLGGHPMSNQYWAVAPTASLHPATGKPVAAGQSSPAATAHILETLSRQVRLSGRHERSIDDIEESTLKLAYQA